MMKKLSITMTVVLISAALAFAQGRKITTLDLEDGTTIQLNMEDSTWQYAKTGYYDMDDDGVYMDLTVGGRNRIMWVKPDGTWTYVTKKPRAKANKMKEYPSLNATGTATHISLNDAMIAAINAVYTNGAANLRKHVPTGIKDTEKILQACLRDRVKENAIDQSSKHLPNKQWRYDTKISLHPYQVKEIMDCFEDQLEKPAEAPAEPKK